MLDFSAILPCPFFFPVVLSGVHGLSGKAMDRTISHYRILDCLGQGGMGEVYKAEDLELNRTVAIKFLSEKAVSGTDATHSLMEEARRAAALNHPHIATIYEVSQADGQPFLVMEYVEGNPLAAQIQEGPLPLDQALNIAIQILEALSVAHARGILHCDIKSSNIMVLPGGGVKVLDFGLARRVCYPTKDRNEEFRDGRLGFEKDFVPKEPAAVSGTVAFMSPEQAKGLLLDERTDVFSAGVLLFQMITGSLPFNGESPAATLRALLNDPPPLLGSLRDDVPLELESIVRKSLEKDRNHRYSTAEEMLGDLKKLRRVFELAPAAVARELTIQPGVTPTASLSGSLLRFLCPPTLARFRNYFFIAAMLAVLAAGFDFFILQRQESGRWRDLGPMLFAVLCTSYAVALRRMQVHPQPVTSVRQGAAFRGLLPFQEADRDRFYGREIDTLALFDRTTDAEFQFGVLFGESGCGKTSLVKAGLVPKLWEGGYVPIYCRSYKEPLALILEECRKRSQIEIRTAESPLEYLRRITKDSGTPLMILCDQFEEFFVNFRTRSEREPFISFVAECYAAPDLPVKFLFSMRSDFLYLINSEFAGRLPEPLMSSRLYHLRNFDAEQAAEIIQKSAEKALLPLESSLIRQASRDLAMNDTVLPSELQIIGDQLQSKRIFTLPEYRRAGGKESLVHTYLEDVIQASGDRDAARLLLRCLISEENTRLTLPLEEIARRTQRGPDLVERILNLFVGSRLIRVIQDEEPWRYELMHEYLIEKINRVTGQVMDAAQRANRLFRQYLSDYTLDKNARIPLGKLWFIRRYSDLAQNERERELLIKSWRWGAIKTGTVALVFVVGATVLAGALSIREEWEETQLTDGHTAAVRQAAFSPDGRLLASCGEDSQVIVWNFARRLRIATLRDHTSWVSAVAFSPDGKWLATSSFDKTVIVYEMEHMQKAVVLRDHESIVNAVAFSPNGQWLVSSGDRTFVWTVGTWKKVHELPLSMSMSYGALLFSPDSRQVMSSNGTVCDLMTGEVLSEYRSGPGTGGNYAAVSPDASRLVTVDGAGDVAFAELPRRGDFSRRKVLYHQDVHEDHGRAVAYSPDGRWVASGSENIVLWDAVKMQKVVRLEHSAIVWSLTFSPDGRWLVSTHGDGAILLWNVAERQRAADLNQHSGPVRAVAFSPDGRRIASASEDHSVIVWDADRRQKITALVGHKTRVIGVVFSPDGRSIASSDQDGTLIVWDVEEGRPRVSIDMHNQTFIAIYCLAISRDGRWLSFTLGVYDSLDGRQRADFTDDILKGLGAIYGLDFSPDGRWLAFATDHGTIALRDVRTWQIVEAVKLSGIQLICLRFSPDGRWLVTGEDQRLVRLWQTHPLREVGILGRHSARIKSVAFSSDGKTVASAGDDQVISIWDVGRRQLVTHVGTHTSPVLSVAFSPDGKRLASGEHDRSVRLYTRHRSLWGYRLD